MKRSILLLATVLSFSTVWSQNVGIGTTSPGTRLDVNGAITLREGTCTVSGTSGTIPNGYSQVRLTGSPSGPFTLTAPAAPANSGEILLIYNNTTGGYAGTFGSTALPNGTATEFIYTNSSWVPTAPASGSGNYIQNQNAAIQPGSTYRISGGAYIGGADTVAGIGYFTSSTASTSATTGAVVVTGGAGISGAINVGGAASVSGALSSGSSSQFQVNATGNIVKINNVTTNFPSAQGASNTVLTNDGSGNYSWSVAGTISVTVMPSNFTTASTSLVNITGLSVPLAANAEYEIEAVMADSASNNQWLNFGVNYTGTGSLTAIVNGLVDLGANGHDLCIQLNAFNTAYLPSGAKGFCGQTGVRGGLLIHGIVNTTTAGNLTIEVENLGAQTATIYAGSFIKATRVQ